MIDAIYIVLIAGGLLVFLAMMGVDVIKLVVNVVLRCLLGIVILYVTNSCIEYFGGICTVSINEVSIAISGILGISGILFLYLLQLYLLYS